MKLRHLNKPFTFFWLFIIVCIFFFFTYAKIWGVNLLVKDWYRQEFVFSGGMTISEFGKANQLKSPLLKNAFGLASWEDFQKTLKDLSLTEKEIFNQVNRELALQAKDENILVKWFNGIMKRLLHNFGLVTKDIQRSGQSSPAVLWLHYELFPFKSVINLAWEPEKSKDQVFEREFCEKRKIDYYNFSWDAGGPKDWGEVDKVIGIIDSCKKPVWIHCKGGKDRTGGLVAIWKKEKGYPIGLIFRDFQTHEVPAFTWVQQLFCGNLSNVQN
jgi:hypothetical protein